MFFSEISGRKAVVSFLAALLLSVSFLPAPAAARSASYAQGRIMYSDGKPAVGVSVSDGFNTSVTDRHGRYRIETCADTWYIYFSHPSDAAVLRNADGCPDFYQRYSPDRRRYDFTLQRIEKEEEFVLLTMADPQAHYRIRDTQRWPDTDRVLNEVVPSVNRTCSDAGLPCYGVTLGDIIYSQGSRDSNPGLAIMRSHFSRMDIPLFQTMGNHDYTFCRKISDLAPDEGSSTVELKAQRAFEDCFGPVNHSFNRGDVHVVCMKDIFFSEHSRAAFTKEQMKWLRDDLANVPADRMVILCVHIPFCYSKDDNMKEVLAMLGGYRKATIFSGHTHFYRGVELKDYGIFEHVHSAVCGQWWWTNVENDGVPNGYNVYRIDGTGIKDAFFVGTNDAFSDRNCQMRIYRGNLLCGGSHGYFRQPFSAGTLLINVFNGDSRWEVRVFENGVDMGTVPLMKPSRQYFNEVKPGGVLDASPSSSNDWWSTGYTIGVVGRGLRGGDYYCTNYHMYRYEMSDPCAEVEVVATDPYGNQYRCSDIIEDGSDYPVSIAAGNN